MGVIISWLNSLIKPKERTPDFLQTNKKNEKTITNPPRWCYDFIPRYVTKHLNKHGCSKITEVTNQLRKYNKDQEVGNSIMLQFDFNIPEKYEERIKVGDVNDGFFQLFEANGLEDEITEKVLQSINWYNVSKKRKYLIDINPIYFGTGCFFDKQSKTKGCKYQLTFRIFYNP